MLQFYLMLIYKNECVVLEYHTEYMLYFFHGTFVIAITLFSSLSGVIICPQYDYICLLSATVFLATTMSAVSALHLHQSHISLFLRYLIKI